MSEVIRLRGEKFYHDLYQQSCYFLPVSKFWETKLLKIGYGPEKIKVHSMGVNCRKFHLAGPKTSPCLELVSVSRLVEKKGIEFAIRAVAKLLARHKDLNYTIVGDGPLRYELERLTIRLKAADNIKFVGAKTQDEIVKILHHADIFLAPSVKASNGDMEGIPVSIMEAMACGLPIVSTLHSGIPELVSHDHSGLLVPERDVGALAGAIELLVKDKAKRVDMGLRGRAIIEDRFDVDQLNRQLERLLMEQVRMPRS